MPDQEDFRHLIESEEKFRDLFDHANDLIHFSSPEGKILYTNAAWMSTLGYNQEELQDRFIFTIIHPDDVERFRNYREQIVRREKETSLIGFRFIKKDGGFVPVEGYVTVRIKDGRPIYTRAILRDVTVREASEQRLQFFTSQILEREENLRQLISHAPDAIIVINHESIIQLWNPMAENIFGWKAEEAVGRSLADTIIPPEYHQAHFAGMRRLMETGVSHILNRTVEVMARNKEDKLFYISLTISSYQVTSKRMFIAFLRDISKQKLNEFELDQRRKQLERSNEELEQFAWLTSHDLKEPLRKIMTFSDLLLSKHRDKLGDEASRFLDKIHSAANRMGKLIEAILVYSNISHERQLYEQIDLNAIVREVINDLEVSIHEKNARIQVDPLPTVEGIPYQMRQLFQNLLSNALKYVQPGIQPEVKISNEIAEGFVKIRIKDNGIGFENVYSEKIFQVFQRLESDEKYQGTGIGLAICKKIVENHDGHISASSEPGKGAEFIIELPFAEKEKGKER